jgi:hypothetical protein
MSNVSIHLAEMGHLEHHGLILQASSGKKPNLNINDIAEQHMPLKALKQAVDTSASKLGFLQMAFHNSISKLFCNPSPSLSTRLHSSKLTLK